MFGDVLVPMDGSEASERALDVAIPIARHLASTLRIVSYADRELLDRMEADINQALGRRDTEGLTVEISVETPSVKVSEMLIDQVRRHPGTLLCLSTHGRGRSELLTGSVANDVLRQITSAVLLIGPKCDTDSFLLSGRVVLPADGSVVSESVVPVATAWAIIMHAPVEVLSVLDPKMANMAATTHGDLTETTYTHRLAKQIGDDLGRTVDYDVLHDKNPAPAIIDHIRDEPVGIVAMATHGATGLARLTVGSVTSEIVRSSPVPVLTIRPPELAS